jgi:ABC-type lipoprotein export system ATPase subunit
VKLSRLDDLKRGIEKRSAEQSPHLTSLHINNLIGFEDIAISPKTSFVAICGGTGLGKTALLDLIYAGLLPAAALGSLPRKARIEGAELRVTISSANTKYERRLKVGEAPQDESGDGFLSGVKLVDLIDRTSLPQTYFLDQDIQILKEGLTSTVFDDELRDAVSMICRKEYTSVSVYEVEDEADHTIPLFEVVESNASYDNRSMATGELSALSLAWALRSASPNSIVLIEEPEAFLPPVGHAAAFGLISQIALKQRLGIVLTTHSAAIASSVPEANLLSIRRSAGRSVLPTGKESKLRTLAALGLRPPKNALLFVEDRLARTILGEILSAFEFDIACNIEIVDTGKGAGSVKLALENMPEGVKTFQFFGVLDGDQIKAAKKWRCKDKILFLPFAISMEKELLDSIEGQIPKFAKLIGRTAKHIETSLDRSKGDDPHDRFIDLARALSRTEEWLAAVAFQHWKAQPGKRRSVRKLAVGLASKMGLVLPGS